MNYSKRMLAIVEAIKKHQILIDIGCDHGYLGILALKTKKVDQVWNVDIAASPLLVAKKNFKKNQLENQAQFYLSDGFQKLPKLNQKAVCVCSGMGSDLILNILKNADLLVEQFVFLTHTQGWKLRKWAAKNNFYVISEGYVKEKQKIYELINVCKTPTNFQYQTDNDLLFGIKHFYENEFNKQHFIEYWTQQLAKLIKIPVEHQKDWQKQQIKQIKYEINTLQTV